MKLKKQKNKEAQKVSVNMNEQKTITNTELEQIPRQNHKKS